jgi:hypothetical protein
MHVAQKYLLDYSYTNMPVILGVVKVIHAAITDPRASRPGANSLSREQIWGTMQVKS